MTAVLTPVDTNTRADRNLRLLPIAANLLPPEVVDARRTRKVRRAVLAGLVAFVLVIAAWFALASYQTASANEELVVTQERVQTLQRQQNEYRDLVAVQSESTMIEKQLTAVMTRDVQWSALSTSLVTAAPAGVNLSAFNASLSAEGSPVDMAGALPSQSKAMTIGTVAIGGDAPSKESIAAYMDVLATIPGLANLYLNQVQVQTDSGRYTFTVRVDVTDALYGGRFTPEKTDKAGK